MFRHTGNTKAYQARRLVFTGLRQQGGRLMATARVGNRVLEAEVSLTQAAKILDSRVQAKANSIL